MQFAIAIEPSLPAAPPPLSAIDFSFPSELGFATSGLGLAACQPAPLEREGEAACPANSKVGSGSAVVAVQFGSNLVVEDVALELYAGPSPDGYLHLLIEAYGKWPIEARIIMEGVVLPGHLRITIPAVSGVPGAPDVSLVRLTVTLGGAITYYERVHGHVRTYRPRGIGLPSNCPHGGWRFGATLAFIGGERGHASDVVGCPTAGLGKR
jgi:hypothetical protein